MATTIKVNGMTISVQNNSKSSENIYAGYDEISTAIATAESATMVDVMAKAYESMYVNVSRSSEGFGDTMKKAGKAIAAGAKKVWDAICKFFRNLIQSIEAFFTGTAIKMRAKALLAKADKNGINEKARMKGNPLKGTASLVKKLAEVTNKLNGVPDTKCETSDEVPELNNIQNAVKAVEKDMSKIGAFETAPADNTIAAVDVYLEAMVSLSGKAKAISIDDIKKFLQVLIAGGTGIFKELIVARDNSKKALTVAMKMAKEATAKTDKAGRKELIRKYKLSTKINNLTYKINIKCIQLALNAITAMTYANPKDDSKSYQEQLKKMDENNK